MPYNTPHTITVGELVTVDTMNDEWGGNVAFLANPPACRVYHSANQSVADATLYTVLFNSERYDTDGMHSTSVNTSRITLNTAGLYLVTFNGMFPSAADYNVNACQIKLNGATVIAEAGIGLTHAGDALKLSVATVYKFAVADYVEAIVYQDNSTSAARNLEALGNKSPEFSATWIGLG